MATKKKFYGKDFQKKMDELKGAHKGVELTKGNRLPHGYEIVKGADKNKDYSKGKKKVVGLKKGYRLAHGYVSEKGAKNKKYETGGLIHEHNGMKYKKQPNGKWMEVSEHGKTKSEHNVASLNAAENKNSSAVKHHEEQASKLSGKEYTDAEIGFEKYATGGGVGYEILDDLKYKSYGKGSTIKVSKKMASDSIFDGGLLNNDEKLFCTSIANRFLKIKDTINESNLNLIDEKELKKAIEENMDSFSDEGRNIAKSVLSKI